MARTYRSTPEPVYAQKAVTSESGGSAGGLLVTFTANEQGTWAIADKTFLEIYNALKSGVSPIFAENNDLEDLVEGFFSLIYFERQSSHGEVSYTLKVQDELVENEITGDSDDDYPKFYIGE